MKAVSADDLILILNCLKNGTVTGVSNSFITGGDATRIIEHFGDEYFLKNGQLELYNKNKNMLWLKEHELNVEQ